MAETYCSSSCGYNELQALDRRKIILDFLSVCYQSSHYKLSLTPNFLSLLQDELDHLTNCHFREILHLIFAVK